MRGRRERGKGSDTHTDRWDRGNVRPELRARIRVPPKVGDEGSIWIHPTFASQEMVDGDPLQSLQVLRFITYRIQNISVVHSVALTGITTTVGNT